MSVRNDGRGILLDNFKMIIVKLGLHERRIDIKEFTKLKKNTAINSILILFLGLNLVNAL